MLNKQTIMQMASKFIGQDKMQAFSSAFDMANKITDMTSNPAEALQKAGVTNEDLQKAKSLLNNPIASMILGDKKAQVVAGLEKAESFLSGGNYLPTEQAPVDELEQMQANLARLK